jgi:WD40 repeat protein
LKKSYLLLRFLIVPGLLVAIGLSWIVGLTIFQGSSIATTQTAPSYELIATPIPVPSGIPATLSPTVIPPTPSDAIHLSEQATWGKGMITTSEYSPDGKRLGVVTTQGVYFYDAESLKQLDFIPGGAAWPATAFSADWSLLAMGSGSTISLLRLADKTEIAHLETDQGKVARLFFSPNGQYLASLVQPPGEEVYTQMLDLWAVPDGKLLGTWKAGAMPELAFTPDSKSLYSWNPFRMDGVWRWQIPSGSPLPVIRGLDGNVLLFSPDGRLMVTTALSPDHQEILIRRVSDGTQIQQLSWENQGYTGQIRFSPDGSRLVALSSDGFVQVWRVSDWNLQESFATHFNNSGYSISLSSNNQSLAFSTPDGIVFYDLSNGQMLRRLGDHPQTIRQAAFSPQNDRVAVLFGDNDSENINLSVLALPQKQILYLLPKVGALRLAWSPQGDRLALANWDGTIRILKSSDGTLLQTLAGHPQQVQSVAWSPDGTQIASSSFSVKVWRVSDGTLLFDLGGSGQWIGSLHYSPDGKWLAGLDNDGKIDVWDTTDRSLISELPVSAYSDSDVIGFAPDGRFLAVAEQSRISLWHIHEGTPFQQIAIPQAGVITLSISPDGKWLTCGLTDGTVQIWQIPQGILLQTLVGGTAGISSLDFTNDGKTLLSASRDGTLHFWSIQR